MANILNILDKDTGKYVSIPAIQGASAYEVALENGFEGTEEEWLASLKGDGADIDLSNLATIDYVDEAVSKIDISDTEVNLEGYATEDWTKEYITDNIETISSGYYEPVDIVGEDVTDDIIAANGELPLLPTYEGGTRYIVNGGIVTMMINTDTGSDSFYINEYEYSDSNQNFVITNTVDGNASDYLIYGAYNADLLSKKDMMASAKHTMNKYANLNSLDGYYPSIEHANDGSVACSTTGWAFYGNDNGEWCDVRIQRGSASANITESEMNGDIDLSEYSSRFASGYPQGILYRKSPCVYFPVKPYTTYTINYTGDTEGEKNYMKGLHWKVLTESPGSAGCWNGETAVKYSTGHEIGTYTKTITTGSAAKYLCLFVGNIKNVMTHIEDGEFSLYTKYTSDHTSSIDTDITKYNIEHLSVVEGTQTYEYYIDMIKDIDFKLNITAMSLLDDSLYEYYELTIPYIMASNQYFRFERQKDMFAVSRALQKAVGMQLNEINDTYLNYVEGSSGVIGKWIDGKDIYRTIMKLTLPTFSGTTNTSVNDKSYTMPWVVDSIISQKMVVTWDKSGYKWGIDGSLYDDDTFTDNRKIRAYTMTYLPDADAGTKDFYTNLIVTYGTSYKNKEIVFIIDHTILELDEDGNVI